MLSIWRKLIYGLLGFRSSHEWRSAKKVTLKNFGNFIGKHLRWNLFYCEYCEIFKNAYFAEHLRTAAFDFLQKDSMFKLP